MAKPCPFCGGKVDPTGWLRNDGVRGPECDCGATAVSMQAWDNRVDVVTPAEVTTSSVPPPEQAFEHHVANPNLFRTLAERLNDFAIYCKVAGYEMEEGDIGPDCARAAVLFTALADVVEESRE